MELSEYWRHEFDYQRAEVLHRSEVQNQLGQGALKSMMLVNGGAIIALLTFVGDKGKVADVLSLKIGMGCFGAGLFSGLLAYFAAYFSQADFMNHAAYLTVRAQAKMVGGEEIVPPKVHVKRGSILLFAAVGLLLTSLSAFALGSAASLNGIL